MTLPQFCEQFRKFAASQLRLYYDLEMMRYFVASMGTARIIILQGISGTGKTSLPYAFGKFVQKDTTVVSVQPSWRERTELYGYFNEFTNQYTETDFLRSIYEANYFRDPHIVILDEMNIARVEYYFAEMLSILEMPRKEEWKVDIVTATWANDPCLIKNGTVQIPDNVWFVGTINNDDSTFAVA
ncbi:MAG: AAA family ATPase, partial [Clostridia bacterium]|nr:AAA family ATPase [Clostridia bacterium]